MLLEEISDQDRNRLPYFIHGVQGEPIRVHFEPLIQSDREALTQSPWLDAVYWESWPFFVEEPKTLKLVRSDGENSEILGLLRLGEKLPGTMLLMKNLLEANPKYRSSIGANREVRGIGKVLVSRLVAESYSLGAAGQVRVKAHHNAIKFYLGIGFKQTVLTHKYDLLRDPARILFESVTS
jgi:hypothetical protein